MLSNRQKVNILKDFFPFRIVPGRVINIKSEAMTSFEENGKLVVGTPGAFQFATMELGAKAIMELPPPMPLVLTVGILVRCIFIFTHLHKNMNTSYSDRTFKSLVIKIDSTEAFDRDYILSRKAFFKQNLSWVLLNRLLVLLQDIKYDSRFRADSMEVLATDFYFEPLAQFVCIGTSRLPKSGDATTAGAGGGHASMGGGGSFF